MKTSPLSDPKRSSLIVPVYYRAVNFFFFAASLTLSRGALSPLTRMDLVTSEGFLSKPLIIIKQIDLYTALVIIFKWMQEGLGKDIPKWQLTAGCRHWVMTYALLNKSVPDTVKSILLHVVHQTIIIKNLISKLPNQFWLVLLREAIETNDGTSNGTLSHCITSLKNTIRL